MEAKTIVTELQKVLKNDTTLKAYVKAVWLGERQSDIKDVYPNIWIEPGDDVPFRVERGNVEWRNFSVILAGAIYHPPDIEKAIVGSGAQKGIMDLETDTLAAIRAAFPDLNRKCLYFQHNTSAYEQTDSGEGRLFTMDILFTYTKQVG